MLIYAQDGYVDLRNLNGNASYNSFGLNMEVKVFTWIRQNKDGLACKNVKHIKTYFLLAR